jgi:hypothetical protein
MMTRFGRLLIISTLLPAILGCGLFSAPQPQPSGESPQTGAIMVTIESHNWSDITIYLVTGGLPQRLGMVTALSNATFDFPSHRLNTSAGVRLRALPVAGRAFTSDPILVQPGQVITWTLENDLDTSSHSVY